MKVILINGKARSGKDFAAQILLKKLDKSVKLAFADSIKDILCNTLGITRSEFDDYKNNHYDLKYSDKSLTFRELIQNFGETMKEKFGNDFWARQLVDSINNPELSNSDYFIVSDFRFKIEYETLSKYLGQDKIVTLYIEDKNLPDNDSHISENALKDFKFDYIIDNTKKNPEILDDYLQSFIDLKIINK